MALLGEFVNIKTGKLDANAAVEGGRYPFFTCSRTKLEIDNYAFDADAILVAGNGDLNVKHYNGKFNAYQRTYVITVGKPEWLDTRYLYHWMSKYVDRLRELSIGGVIKYIKLRMLTDAEIPLPPLEEQKRIAAILDKADALRRKRQQAIDLTDRLLRSVFLDMFGDPVTNPKGWTETVLDKVLDSIESGQSPNCLDRPATDNEVGVLKLSSISYGVFNSSENKALPDSVELARYISVSKGELLLSRKNTYELVGASALVKKDYPNLVLPDLIFKLKFNENCGLLNEYMHGFLSHPSIRHRLRALASGSAGSMPNISKARLGKLKVLVPSVESQIKFKKLISMVDVIIEKFDGNDSIIKSLYDGLAQRAFRGDLRKQTEAA